MTERRKYMRFSSLLDVIYKNMGGPALKVKSCLKDLSKEGLRLSAENPLEKGSTIEMELHVPGSNAPIVADGLVAWTEKTALSNYDHGIRFTRIRTFDRALLLDHVYDEWIKSKKFKRSV